MELQHIGSRTAWDRERMGTDALTMVANTDKPWATTLVMGLATQGEGVHGQP